MSDRLDPPAATGLAPSRPRGASLAARARNFTLEFTRRGVALRLPQTAASLTLLSLLALVPVFSIAVSLLGALPMLSGLRDALLRFLAANLFLPSFSETLIRYLNQFAAKVNQLSLLGALVFFASAVSVLLTIDRTMNQIWETDRPRSLARRLTVYWTFLTLGPLLLASSLAVNGVIVSEVFGAARLQVVERAWLMLLPWIMTTGGLTLLYRLVPTGAVRWRDAVVGALVAAVLLDLIKRMLGLQLARLPTYTIVYGAFAALPLFLIWLYLLWLIVLAGALLTASLPYWGAGALHRRQHTPAQRFDTARAVLRAVRMHSPGGRAPLPARSLRALFGADPGYAAETVRLLAALGYVHRHWRADTGVAADAERAIWDESWLLAPDAQTMTLRPLFEALWSHTTASSAGRVRSIDLATVDRTDW